MVIVILLLIILYLYGIGLFIVYEFIAEGEWDNTLLMWPLFFLLFIENRHSNDDENEGKQMYFTP